MNNPFETIDARLSNIECLILDMKQTSKEQPLNNNEEENLIKIEDVCRIFNVSQVTIHSYKKRGLIPFYRISNKIYFKRSEVIASLNKINGEA